MKTRIYCVCHSTPLMVVQHLRTNAGLPPAREFLLRDGQPNAPWMASFMDEVIASAGFEDVLELKDLELTRPRTQSAPVWWFESARRARRDGARARAWLRARGVRDDDLEVWTEEPIHFDTVFAWALFRSARHVKYPECLYREDDDSRYYKARLEERWTRASWAKRSIYWPWLRLASGLDFGARPVYERGYTFDQPNPWSAESVDVSRLISAEALQRTYEGLPLRVRDEIQRQLEPIARAPGPRVLLLLFGLGPESGDVFERSLLRIVAERRRELEGCTLIVKFHPGASGELEEGLVTRLAGALPGRVHPLRSGLNLEFLLPALRPDYVLGGPSGAMPVVRRLGGAKPVAMREVMEAIVRAAPQERRAYEVILRGVDTW